MCSASRQQKSEAPSELRFTPKTTKLETLVGIFAATTEKTPAATKNYLYALRSFQKWLAPTLKRPLLTMGDIEVAQAHLDEFLERDEVSPSTRQVQGASLHAFFRWIETQCTTKPPFLKWQKATASTKEENSQTRTPEFPHERSAPPAAQAPEPPELASLRSALGVAPGKEDSWISAPRIAHALHLSGEQVAVAAAGLSVDDTRLRSLAFGGGIREVRSAALGALLDRLGTSPSPLPTSDAFAVPSLQVQLRIEALKASLERPETTAEIAHSQREFHAGFGAPTVDELVSVLVPFNDDEVAQIVGVTVPEVREWKAGRRVIPYAHWRLFILLTGRVSLPI